MAEKKYNLIVVMSLCLLCALAVQPLTAGLPRGHDTLLHFYRIPEMNSLFSQGILYSRWQPDLMFGYGYPLLNFYPPLSPYLLTACYWLFGQNAVVGTAAGFALALIAGILGMYLASKTLFGRLGGLVAAAAYSLAPHFLYQTYERGSISTALAMAAFPWVVWTLVRAARQGNRWIGWAALAILLMMASHTSASLMFLPALIGLGLTLVLSSAADERRICGNRIALALLAGLGLSAFIWVPSLTEFHQTQYSLQVSPSKIAYDQYYAEVWKWPGQVLDKSINPPLNSTPGLTQMALAVAALLASVARLRDGKSQMRPIHWFVVVCAILGLAYVFISTRFADFLWDHLPFLVNVQYPWRFLDVGTLLIALAGAGLLADAVRWKRYVVPVLLIAMYANALPYLYPPRWQHLPQQPTLAEASQAQAAYEMLGLTSWGEYLPATATWIAREPAYPGSDQGVCLALKLQLPSLAGGKVIEWGGNSLYAKMSLALDKPTTLVFDTYYYPGWHAQIDGARAAVTHDQAGLIALEVPAGTHQVLLYFGETWQRAAADALSSVTLALLIGGIAFSYARHGKKIQPSSSPGADSAGAVTWLMPVLLAAFLAAKITYLDRYDTPLVVHETNGHVRGMESVEAQQAGEIKVLAYSYHQPDLTLYWYANEKPSASYRVQLALVDSAGNIYLSQQRQHPGFSPTHTWEEGQLVYDRYHFALEALPHSGLYDLHVSLYKGESKEADLDIKVTTIMVPAQLPAEYLGITFDDKFALNAYEMPAVVAQGDNIELNLYWSCLHHQDVDYTIFIHFISQDGTLMLAADSPPLSNTFPTRYWQDGDTIRDTHEFAAALPPGEYQLEVGWYLAETGERLQAAGPGATEARSVILGTMTVIKGQG